MKTIRLIINERPHYLPDFPYGAMLKVTTYSNRPYDTYVKEITYQEYQEIVRKYEERKGLTTIPNT